MLSAGAMKTRTETRHLRADRGARRPLLGRADPALAAALQDLRRAHAARAHPRAGAGQEGVRAGQRGPGPPRRKRRRGAIVPGRRRGARRQARRRVPARDLADGQRHPDEHERQRGARQPGQRAPRRRARGEARRSTPTTTSTGRSPPTTSSPPPCTWPRWRQLEGTLSRGARRCATRSPPRPRAFARRGEDRAHAPAGRDAAHAGPGVLGLRRAARPCASPRSQRRAARACASWPSAAPRWAPASTRRPSSASGWRTTLAELTGLAVRDRAQQVRGAGRARARLVHAHGALKTLAAALNKIANDVRWLASGPRSRHRRDHHPGERARQLESCPAR